MKILVADDDTVQRQLLRLTLGRWKHEVLEAEDGARAWELCQDDTALQVLLLDWMMPGLDGLDLCRRVRGLERDHYVFIILITSRTGREDFLKGMSAGADDFITKPVDPEELQARLQVAERIIHLKSDLQLQSEINRELRELDRMKSAFIGLTTHELRTPLTILSGMLTIMDSGIPESHPGLREKMATAIKSAQRLEKVVLRTFKISHEGEFRERLKKEPSKIDELVRHAIEEISPFIQLRRQNLVIEVAHGLPEIMIDCNMILDVLINLLMNAIKFTPDEGVIRIAASMAGAGMVRFDVIDTGVGISDSDKPHIFEPYFSTLDILHHSSGEFLFEKRGIGLGLSIVKQFVEMHRGVVEFESTLGEGTNFHFTIPVAVNSAGGRGI